MNDTLSISPSITTITPSGTVVAFPRRAGGTSTLAIRGTSSDPALTAFSERQLRVGHTTSKGVVRSLIALDTNRVDVDGGGLPISPSRESTVQVTFVRPTDGQTYAEFLADLKLMVNLLTETTYATASAMFNQEL